MRFAIVFSGCLGLVTTSLLNGAQFSETRDLPALKLTASELDSILSKAHSFVNAVNGPTMESPTREAVKLDVGGHRIEIPHFSLASSVAFPNEIFGFSYAYHQSDKPISSITIDLGDSSRRVSVSGESADKVRALSNLLENDFHRYATVIGGVKFRRVTGVCLSMFFLTSLMIKRCVFLENSKLHRIRNADLFYDRLFARDPRAMEQVASRVCAFPTLFPFFSSEACVSDFHHRPPGGACWNSRVVFSFAKGPVAILLAAQIRVPMFFALPRYLP